MDVVNRDAGPGPLSAKVPMLETDAAVTESETGFTETADPAAASTDCVACIELKPFLGCISFCGEEETEGG